MKTAYPLYSKYQFGDMTVLFLNCQEKLILSVIPSGMEEDIPEHRHDINDTVGYRSNHIASGNDSIVAKEESMVQLHIMGDAFAYADTLRGGESVQKQKLVSQTRENNTVITRFADERGIELTHTLEYRPSENFFTTRTEVRNSSKAAIELGMIEAVSLGMLSPFREDHAPDALKIYRYRSCWSAEGREMIHDPEELALTVPWNGGWPTAVRYGQRSSMTTREWFPTAGLTDTEAGVSWAVQLAAVQPWQMCISRNGDFLALSGGPVDFDFADWRYTLEPGESYTTFPAVLTCVKGSMEKALERLTEYPLKRTEFPMPAAEKDLPVLFNEFCTTWGCPTEKNLLPVIENVRGLGFRYFVIDGGWGRDVITKQPGIGEWKPVDSIYPSGFGMLVEKIREAGMIPGIWFEFECALANTPLYKAHPDWFVTFRGEEYRLNTDRHFLDFRKKEVQEYLDERVIGFLKKYNFGYMKVDYNAKIHLADSEKGSASAGVGEVLESIYAFYEKVRRELPELVLEICSSGGNRLSPGWMQVGSMASCTDCHEGVALPLVAADTLKQIPFRMNQVWCTLRQGEDPLRTGYLLAGGFLGRMCLSGDAAYYSEFQKDAIRKAVALYQEAYDVLEEGSSTQERHLTSSAFYTPKGYQLCRRKSAKGEVLVLHLFEDAPKELDIPTDAGRIAGTLNNGEKIVLQNGKLHLEELKSMSALVFLLR